jgi:hypothetical protein
VPDQGRPARARLDQVHPPQDQRAHDQLADLRLRHQQGAQRLGIEQKRLDLPARAPIHQRGLGGELAHLREELAHALDDHGNVVPQAVAPADGDLAPQHHEQARSGLAGFEQEGAVRPDLPHAQAFHARDLLGRKLRKGLLRASREAGRQNLIGVHRHSPRRRAIRRSHSRK